MTSILKHASKVDVDSLTNMIFNKSVLFNFFAAVHNNMSRNWFEARGIYVRYVHKMVKDDQYSVVRLACIYASSYHWSPSSVLIDWTNWLKKLT